jgi:hypothetical protein
VTHVAERRSELVETLRNPQQRTLGIAPRRRLNETLEVGQQRRIALGQRPTAAAFTAYTTRPYRGSRWLHSNWLRPRRAGCARKAAAAAIVEALDPNQIARIDDLVANNADFGMSPLAWRRNFEEAPTAANINGLLARLRYARGMGINAVVSRAIPEFRFVQFVREGSVAPSFLLSDYSLNRRRATLTAAVIDLEARLADAAIQMFDRLIGGLFTRARHGRERRYQDSIQSVGQLMRLFGATISAIDETVQHGSDPLELIDEMVGWHKLVAAKAQVNALADLAGEDVLVTATERYATLRRFSPGLP